jgi:hypothetical protein
MVTSAMSCSSGGDYQNVLQQNADRVNRFLERHFWLCAAVFVAVYLTCSLIWDSRCKMWLDEFFTLFLARLRSPIDIVKATMEGVDAAPPLYAVLVSWLLPVVRSQALAVRLPSTLGFCAMVVCVLAFCRRRMPAAYAFSAALLAATATSYYATEGRCYGMVLFCAAGALLCWQRAVEDRARSLSIVLLGICLALMTALHYYSIFFLIPLGLAEAVRSYNTKRLDLPVAGAMGAALAVLAIHLPLLVAGSRYLPHFWPDSIASWHHVLDFYVVFYSLIPISAFLIALVILSLVTEPSARRLPRNLVLPMHEQVLVCVLAVMPFVVVVLAKCTTHVFLKRYVLWAVVGLGILTASVLCAVARGDSRVGLAVLALLLSVSSTQLWLNVRQAAILRDSDPVFRELQRLQDGSQCILVSSERVFMEMSYYAAPQLSQRLIYPLSRGLELRYRGSDVNFFQMSALSHRTSLRIVDLDEFLQTNPRFLVAARREDYLPRYLREVGYSVAPVCAQSDPVLYQVEGATH